MSEEQPLTTDTSSDVITELDKKAKEIRQAQISGNEEKVLHLWHDYVELYMQTHPEDMVEDREEVIERILSRYHPDIGLVSGSYGIVLAIMITQEYPLRPSEQNVNQEADPITMFNGEFVYNATDFKINGAGIEFVFERTYKNQANFNGPLGANWDFSYNLWLQVVDNSILRSTGQLRKEIYHRHAKFGSGTTGFDYWVPPTGQFGIIRTFPDGSSYVWISPDGTSFFYNPDPFEATIHKIALIQDRFGNYLRFKYDGEQRLGLVEVNHPSRLIQFGYDSLNRIVSINDYSKEFGVSGRLWQFHYDDWNDLVGMTSPASEQYPEGLTTIYEYSSSQFDFALMHNLTRIIDPEGQVYLENVFGSDRNTLSFNRVVRQRQGVGLSQFEYSDVVQEFECDYTDAERPKHQTIMIGRNGHATRNVYNKCGNLILKEEKIAQGGSVRLLKWRYRYNADGALIGVLSPEGSVVQYFYGRDHFLRNFGIDDTEVDNHEELTAEIRMGFGNLLATVKRGQLLQWPIRSLSAGLWGDCFPDVLTETDDSDIIIKYAYEPYFQQMLTSSDPRYTESADPDFHENQSYHDTLTKYDYALGPSNEPHFLLSRIKYPACQQADENETLQTEICKSNDKYDDRGRLLKTTDPEGIVTLFEYFSQYDNFKEGYLRRKTIDPSGLAICTQYDVNEVGIVKTVIHPNGKTAQPGYFRTVYQINAHDKVAQQSVSLPFAYESRFIYNRNSKLVRVERDLKDDTGHFINGGSEVKTYQYDDQYNLLKETYGGANLKDHSNWSHRYDASDQRTGTTLPAGNEIWYSYNERLLKDCVTRGACTPEATTIRFIYNGNGLKIKEIDGRGNEVNYGYDAFNRLTTTRDSFGNMKRICYDKADNVTAELFFEKKPDGTFLLLTRLEYQYDELNRRIKKRQNFFETPIPSNNPLSDFEGSLDSGTLIEQKYFYDRKGRLIKTVNFKGQESTSEYDAMDRTIRQTDQIGNYKRFRYDDNGNLVRCDIHELVLDPVSEDILREDVFSTCNKYDELDRPIEKTDSMGNSYRYCYDSCGNLVKQIDPLGNVQRFEYDVYGRKIAEISEITTTGLGDSPLFSEVVTTYKYNRNGNLIAVIDAKGNRTEQEFDALDRLFLKRYPDGSTERYNLDKNNNIVSYQDNNGLVRLYTFDAMNRLECMELDTSQLPTDNANMGATFERYEYDGLGRTICEENDFCTLLRRFNSMGLVYNEVTSFHLDSPDGSLSQSYLVKRQFDSMGFPTQLTYPSERQINYHLDSLNRIRCIENATKGNEYCGSDLFGNQYDILTQTFRGLRIAQTHFGNNAATNYAYDKNGRPIQIEHVSADGTNMLTIQQLYDAMGNLRLKNEVRPISTIGDTYKYNSLYWLTKVEKRADLPHFFPAEFQPFDQLVATCGSLHGQSSVNALLGSLADNQSDFTFRYDPVGNRIEEKEGDQILKTYSSNILNQYTSISSKELDYDQNGNLIADRKNRYFYDFRNQLVRVDDVASGQAVVQFYYDTQCRRIISSKDGELTHFVYNGQNVIEEYKGSAVFTQYVLGYELDTLWQIASEGKEHWYHRDLSHSTRILTGSTGNQVTIYLYTPFGELKEHLGDTSLYNPYRFNGRRYNNEIDSYDYRLRQYSQSIGRFLQRDINNGSNLYMFLVNNPLTAIDPMGTDRQKSYSLYEIGDFTLNLDDNIFQLTIQESDYLESTGLLDRILDRHPSFESMRSWSEMMQLYSMYDPRHWMYALGGSFALVGGGLDFAGQSLLAGLGSFFELVDPDGAWSLALMQATIETPYPHDDALAMAVRSSQSVSRLYLNQWVNALARRTIWRNVPYGPIGGDYVEAANALKRYGVNSGWTYTETIQNSYRYIDFIKGSRRVQLKKFDLTLKSYRDTTSLYKKIEEVLLQLNEAKFQGTTTFELQYVGQFPSQAQRLAIKNATLYAEDLNLQLVVRPYLGGY